MRQRYNTDDVVLGLRVTSSEGNEHGALTGKAKITDEGLFVEVKWDDGMLSYYHLDWFAEEES